VTAKGLAQRELFVLLDGACDVREGRRVITALRRGDVIGEVALFGTPGRQLASVYTHTRSEILVLPRRSFRALRATDPGAAADALYALSRVMADRVAANRY
jgi:CRP-like cAMP-binding protein